MPTTRERRSDRHGASVPRLTRQCPGDEGHAVTFSRIRRIHNAKLFAVNVRTYVRPGQQDSTEAAIDCAAAVD